MSQWKNGQRPEQKLQKDGIQKANKHMKICLTSCFGGNVNKTQNEIQLHIY